MKRASRIPSGPAHLDMVAQCASITFEESLKCAPPMETERRAIGTAMSALYQAATCHRKCHGGPSGPHVFEALCARIYNLASSAYLLSLRGFYDEALNLMRCIGEASNLVALSAADEGALKDWLQSDKPTRLRKFSPAKIRKLLQEKEPALLITDGDWYSRFCEEYTHVVPQTKPNVHNIEGRGWAGGVYQAEGFKTTLEELANILLPVSLIVCKYFEFSDLFNELAAVVDKASVEEESDKATAKTRYP